MAIVSYPADLEMEHPLACSICRVRLLLDKATAGLFDVENHQAFACVSHFSEVELLIAGWADFMSAERQKHLRHKREAEALGMGNDAWLNS